MAKAKKDSARAKLARKSPYTRSVSIVTDSMIEQKLLELEEELKIHQAIVAGEQNLTKLRNANNEIKRLEPLIAEQKQMLEDASIEFVFRALPAKVYERLVREHRATTEQKRAALEMANAEGLPKAAAQKLTYNPDTFPPAIIAATLIEPQMTVEEVVELIWGYPEDSEGDPDEEREEIPADSWNATERAVLFNTARNVCQGLALPR